MCSYYVCENVWFGQMILLLNVKGVSLLLGVFIIKDASRGCF